MPGDTVQVMKGKDAGKARTWTARGRLFQAAPGSTRKRCSQVTEVLRIYPKWNKILCLGVNYCIKHVRLGLPVLRARKHFCICNLSVYAHARTRVCSMYVCMYVPRYVRRYVCMYACMYVGMHVCMPFMNVCMYVCMYVCVYVFRNMSVSIYVSMCICVSVYLCIHVSMYLSVNLPTLHGKCVHMCAVCMYVCMYAVCMYVCIYVCMYVCNVCIYVLYEF